MAANTRARRVTFERRSSDGWGAEELGQAVGDRGRDEEDMGGERRSRKRGGEGVVWDSVLGASQRSSRGRAGQR